MGFRKFKVGEWEFRTLWFIAFWFALIGTILAIVALSGISGGWFSANTGDYHLQIGSRKSCLTGKNNPILTNSSSSQNGTVPKCDVNKAKYRIGSANAAAGNTALAMCVFTMLLGIIWTLGAILVSISVGPDRTWQFTLIGSIVNIIIMSIGWIVFVAVIKAKGVFVDLGINNVTIKVDIESRFGVAVACSVFWGIASALMGWGRIQDVDAAVMRGEGAYGAH